MADRTNKSVGAGSVEQRTITWMKSDITLPSIRCVSTGKLLMKTGGYSLTGSTVIYTVATSDSVPLSLSRESKTSTVKL